MIIVAIMGSFILAEKIYLGGVLGAILIVIGLYSVLWGKYKEYQEKEAEANQAIPPEAIKSNPATASDVQNDMAVAVITVRVPQTSLIVTHAPKA
ncbi:hypothetical protein SLA2020_358480 [Shorea laevis]